VREHRLRPELVRETRAVRRGVDVADVQEAQRVLGEPVGGLEVAADEDVAEPRRCKALLPRIDEVAAADRHPDRDPIEQVDLAVGERELVDLFGALDAADELLDLGREDELHVPAHVAHVETGDCSPALDGCRPPAGRGLLDLARRGEHDVDVDVAVGVAEPRDERSTEEDRGAPLEGGDVLGDLLGRGDGESCRGHLL